MWVLRYIMALGVQVMSKPYRQVWLLGIQFGSQVRRTVPTSAVVPHMLAYLGFDRQVFVLQPLLTNDKIWYLVALSNGCKTNSRGKPAMRVTGKRPLESLALKVTAEDAGHII